MKIDHTTQRSLFTRHIKSFENVFWAPVQSGPGRSGEHKFLIVSSLIRMLRAVIFYLVFETIIPTVILVFIQGNQCGVIPFVCIWYSSCSESATFHFTVVRTLCKTAGENRNDTVVCRSRSRIYRQRKTKPDRCSWSPNGC